LTNDFEVLYYIMIQEILTHLGKFGISCLALIIGFYFLWFIGKLLSSYFMKTK